MIRKIVPLVFACSLVAVGGLRADGLDKQRRDDGRIDAARKSQQYFLVADLFLAVHSRKRVKARHARS